MIELLIVPSDEDRRQASPRIVCFNEPLSELLNTLIRTEDGRIRRLGELEHPRSGTWTDHLVERLPS